MANTSTPVNHTVSGVRVRSKIVPGVTAERPPDPAHQNRPSASRQPPRWPQLAHRNPSGHRSHLRSRQSASVGNHAISSPVEVG